MINRRSFLKIIGILGGLSILSYFALPGFEVVIGRMIARDLSNLKLEKGAVSKFLIDARKNGFLRKFGWGQQQYMTLYYALNSIHIPLPFMDKYNKYKTMIVGQFLLSTDFFYNKMDQNKTIKYLAYYDPYQKPCAHPFSNRYYKNNLVTI